ncbi:MAG: hypothetical protein ACREL3_04220 [Gemmatimonadales bacterium]
MKTLVACSALAAPLAAQQDGISRGFELERRGEYAAAADAYRSVLAARPADPAALLGLERVMVPLNRTGELLPEVRAALAAPPLSGVVYGVALRAWAAADEPDSMRVVAERWARFSPTDEAPYREWGAAAITRGDHQTAVAAYALGRERLQRADALAAERAQLAAMDGNYPDALGDWLAAVRRLPGYRLSAVAAMAQAPAAIRPDLLRTLSREPDLVARRMEAELRVRWGDPVGGLAALVAALPDDRAASLDALGGIIDQLRTQQTPEGRLALARGLEALADRATDADRSRLRLDAARAYTAAGDRGAARRMLAGLAEDRSASAPVAAGASAALIQVLISEGRLDDAARRLEAAAPALSHDELAALRLRLVGGWLKEGNLDKADSALGSDSTVEGLAMSGRVRLFKGDIAGALERFRKAGPYAGDRNEATNRTMLLAMLQPIESDSLPALGRAMLQLEQGDTSRATAALEEVARGLPAAKGGAEIGFFAGRLAAATGDRSVAERLFRGAASKDAPATAPAAELALGELFLAQNRSPEAVVQLEHMILTYPESALVPQARRRLDQARGAVPKT